MRRLEARPGPAAAHGPAVRPCQPGGRLSETGVAIARACLRRVETVIAFAGAKWVFLSAVFGCRGDVGFNGPLSGVSSGVVGFNVATLSHLVREKVRPAWPDVCVSAKKFALHAQNTPKSAFLHLLGEFFRANPTCADLGCSAAHFRLAADGGFAALGTGCRRVAGVSHP